ncbi:hypothetical protein [Novosphingobium sp. AP12]|uniref:hypothetical protein n=1 Tax=Novosphingobium sp. AP12 TaxID=1144305 RepID=UPI0012F79047|nr:hypothetical protein [Novosphingobium sp. AP12]
MAVIPRIEQVAGNIWSVRSKPHAAFTPLPQPTVGRLSAPVDFLTDGQLLNFRRSSPVSYNQQTVGSQPQTEKQSDRSRGPEIGGYASEKARVCGLRNALGWDIAAVRSSCTERRLLANCCR